MRSTGTAIAKAVTVLALAAMGTQARADEPPSQKTAQPDEPQPAAPDEPSPLEIAQPATQPRKPLQVATDPPGEHSPEPPPPGRAGISDGAGPRIAFGRTWNEGLNEGFYGRFESEYFEVKGRFIQGGLVGLEGWGTEGATAGGGSIIVGAFAGARAGPSNKKKGPAFLFTLGVGVHAILYDRVGDEDGFGLLSPYGAAVAGVEIIPGLRLLCDGRAVYRWHWTAASQGQIQVGVTLGLNSYLWDGP